MPQLYAHVANESKGPKGLFLHGGGVPQVGEINRLVGLKQQQTQLDKTQWFVIYN